MLFDYRDNLMPFEYPICESFVDAINSSFWVHSEWNFIQDIHEYNNVLTDNERETIKRTMLAISQVEVAVKSFWSDLGKIIPKPEVSMVGATFSESEVRHLRAYSQLLAYLGLSHEFMQILNIPCIKGRIQYLKKYSNENTDPKSFLKSLLLFSLFIENVSLFSQFYVIACFKKMRNLLSDMTKVVNATAQEENLHAEFGIFLANTIMHEYDIPVEEIRDEVIEFAEKAYKCELKVIDWIMEYPTFIDKEFVHDFLKYRFNISLNSINIESPHQVNNRSSFSWYQDLVSTSIHSDFFTGRPNTYSLKTCPITAENLF